MSDAVLSGAPHFICLPIQLRKKRIEEKQRLRKQEMAAKKIHSIKLSEDLRTGQRYGTYGREEYPDTKKNWKPVENGVPTRSQ